MKETFYFAHDYNARNDQKILEVRSTFGWEGYAIYFALLEFLCESKGYIKREALGGLSLGLSLHKDSLITMIDFFINVGLFVEGKNGIYSKRIIEHLAYRKKLSDAGKLGGRGNKATEVKPPFSQAKASLEAVKERKGKEIKGKEIKERDFISEPFLEIFNNWMEYKRERKESYKSIKSEKVFYDSLIEFSNNDPAVAFKIIKQSMASNWAGIFPLKNNSNGTNQKNLQPGNFEVNRRDSPKRVEY
jgi:hypothetical protein